MSNEQVSKYKHSTATVDGFGHTTICGKVDLVITVRGGRDVFHHALLVKAIQDFQESLVDYAEEVYRVTKEECDMRNEKEVER